MSVYYKVPMIKEGNILKAEMDYYKNRYSIGHFKEDYAYLMFDTESDAQPNDKFVQITEEEFNEQIPQLNYEDVVVTEYQPTNAEVAHMISDLQADLIIAGVIEA